ncbi:MAG: DUF3024 domain-containing protein [Nakamurella sp.]
MGLYFVAVLSADLRHFLDLPDDVPGPARRLAAQLGDLVRAATAAEPGPAWISALPCRRRPGHRACPGRMMVRRAERAAPIVFECTDCGDGGIISGWQDSPYDGSGHLRGAAKGIMQISISALVADTLRALTFLDRNCQRVVFGARSDRADVVLAVTQEELEELIGSVAAEANHEPNRRRRRRLDAAFESLEIAALQIDQLRAVPDVARGDVGRQSTVTQAGPAGLPDLDVARVQRWCAARVPEPARHQVRVECQRAARHLTIVERRAPWSPESGPEWTSTPIAELRYDHTAYSWTLFGRDRNMRFHAYGRLPASPQIEVLLTELGADPTGIFWG